MFETFELEGALARFELLLLDNDISEEDRAHVHLWKGLTEAELGRFREATDSFERALVLAPEATLPLDASPKVVEMLEEARARAAKRTPPALEVATKEDGTVYPKGPGVLIKTTVAGRMDAALQERPAEPSALDELKEEERGLPWLVFGGTATAALGVLTLGGGGLLGALALTDHGGAVEALGAKEAVAMEAQAQRKAVIANVLFGVGGAVVALGVVVAGVGLASELAE